MLKFQKIKLACAILILAISVALAFQIVTTSNINQLDKQDYAEINHIKYGLLSVNKWKEQVTRIVLEEVSNLSLSRDNAKQLKKHIEAQLDGLIDKVEEKVKASNQGSAKGWLKQAFIEAFVDMKDIKKGIPDYANTIVAEMTKTKTENKIKNVVKKKIEGHLDQTFAAQDLTKVNLAVARIGATNIETAKISINEKISNSEKKINTMSSALIVLSIILFLIFALGKQILLRHEYVVLTISLCILVIVGIAVPMIDLEAKISEMSFFLLNRPITFTDQVLYFQSKSILDVFWIMITNSSFQMKIVGILIATFSIFFPLVKIISSVWYYYDINGAQENKWIRFFVLKSGKWSMADVMIIAIFMAYIGFNGMITSQFGNFELPGEDLVLLTTNGTSLQAGFYIFFTFVVLSLFFSSKLGNSEKQMEKL